MTEFVSDFAPDQLFCVGDEADCTEPARWSKATAVEFSPTLRKALAQTTTIMAEFQSAARGAPFHISRSNHLDRLETYMRRYAPAFAAFPELSIESLLRYDELGIEYHRRPYEFAPGWVLCHGDEGSTIQTSGGTALGLAKKFGKSVVCGHTHRAGIQALSEGISGRTGRTLFGVEVGNAMDLRQASYLKGGTANWQQAFGILRVENKVVHPQLVYVRNGRFVVEDKEYRV
jgi:hypothetical protein